MTSEPRPAGTTRPRGGRDMPRSKVFSGFAVATIGVLALTVSLASQVIAAGGWSPETSGTSNHLNGVSFVDADHGWAVGVNGTILATPDGGASWSAETSGTSYPLGGVSFVDANHGWAVGAVGTILATVDAGASWSAQTSGTSDDLDDVSFVDDNHGWAVSDSGTILATADGGASWSVQTSVSSGLNGVSFVDANHGWAVEYDQTSVRVVRHVLAGLRERVHARKVPGLAEIGAYPFVEFLNYLVRIARELLGAIVCQLGNGRLGRVPIARTILVEVSRGGAQTAQSISEDRRRFSWHNATKPDATILEFRDWLLSPSARSRDRSSVQPAGRRRTARGSECPHRAAAAARSVRPRRLRSPAPNCRKDSASARTERADRRSRCWRGGSTDCDLPSPTGCGSPQPSDAARRAYAGTSPGWTSRCRAGHDPAVSGADPIEARPGFSALLDRIEGNGVCIVLIEDASRFARDLIAQELGIVVLVSRGVRVITANGDDLCDTSDPSRVMMRQIAGAFAQYEKARLVARLRRAREIKGKMGGRKSLAQTRPEVVELARKLGKPTRSGKRRSLREVSASHGKAEAQEVPIDVGFAPRRAFLGCRAEETTGGKFSVLPLTN